MPNYDIDDIDLINQQLITTFISVCTLIVSFLLTYNDRLELLNKPLIFSKTRKITIINRTIILICAFSYLYINYMNDKKTRESRKNTKFLDLQVSASVLTIIAAIIVLYVVFYTAGTNNEAGIENPEI